MADERVLQIVLKAVDDASATLKKAQSEIEGLGKSATSTTSMWSKVGTVISDNYKQAAIGAGIFLAGATAVAKGMVDQTATYEQNRVAFENMLGSADKARTLLSQLSDFAVKTPFNLPEVVTAGKQILAYGISAQQVVPTLTMIGDAAAKMSVPMQQAIDVWAEAKAGLFNTRMYAPLGVTREQLEQFGVQFKKTGQVVNSSKLLPALEAIWGGKGTAGLMAEQAKTFSGTLANLGDDMKRFSINVLGMNDNGDIRQGSVFYYLKQGAQQLLAFVDRIRPQVTAFIDGLLHNKDAVLGFFGALAGIVLLAVGAFIVANAAAIAIVAAFAAVGAGISLLVTHWQDITNWVNQHRDAIIAVMALFAPWMLIIVGFVALVKQHWNEIVQYFQTAWKQIGDGIDWMTHHWAEAIGLIIGFFLTLPIRLPQIIGDAIVGMVRIIAGVNWGQVFSVIATSLQGAFQYAISWVTHVNWGSLFKGVVEGAVGGIPGLGKALHTLHIPGFADGGWVKDTGIALVHKGEYVLSNAMLRGQQPIAAPVASRGAQVTFTGPITLSSGIDIDHLGQRLAWAMNTSGRF